MSNNLNGRLHRLEKGHRPEEQIINNLLRILRGQPVKPEAKALALASPVGGRLVEWLRALVGADPQTNKPKETAP